MLSIVMAVVPVLIVSLIPVPMPEAATGSDPNCGPGSSCVPCTNELIEEDWWHHHPNDPPFELCVAGPKEIASIVEGRCIPEHGVCGDPGSEELFALVNEESTHGLEMFLTEHADNVVLNVERGALQLLDCDGNVALHLPVPHEVLSTLTVALDATGILVLDRP